MNRNDLSSLDLKQIAAEHHSGISLRKLAERYAVPRSLLAKALKDAGFATLSREEMAAHRMIPLDAVDICSRFDGGESVLSIATSLCVSSNTVKRHLIESGRTEFVRLVPVDTERICTLFDDGESVFAIAQTLGIGRTVVVNRLLRAGRKPRSGGEAQRIRNARLGAAQRLRNAENAHAAVRGMKRSFDELCRRAKSRQDAPRKPSEYELHLRSLLTARGIETIREQAIGPYNCDIGAFPVAVEIFGGDWHWSGRHIARLPQRTKYILDAGWSIVTVHVTKKAPIVDATADYLAAHIEKTRRDPALRGEYRMIRGAGEVVTVFRPDRDEIPAVESLKPPRRTAAQR